MSLCTSFVYQLAEWGKKGYQTVFDEHGIGVYYRFCVDTEHLYDGDNPVDALIAIEDHWDGLEPE